MTHHKFTIALLPLDERPCNIEYPRSIVGSLEDLRLITPPPELLGKKKRASDVDGLYAWLESSWSTLDAAVISLEQLLYGGLLPSRLHHLDEETARVRWERFRRLAAAKPAPRLYLFGLVMRCPSYDSSDEEPDYYAAHGAAIHRIGALEHRRGEAGLAPDEAIDLSRLRATVPVDFIDDYLKRRAFNLRALKLALRSVEEGWAELFCVPQDDTAPWGYSTMDRSELEAFRLKTSRPEKILVYPGADEAGCELCARAAMELRNSHGPSERSSLPPLALLYTDEEGLEVVPRYEDQPIIASLSAHLRASGIVDAPRIELGSASTLSAGGPRRILALHLPYKATREAPPPEDSDGDAAGRLRTEAFALAAAQAIAEGHWVYLADLKYTNGADPYLVKRLAKLGALERLAFYSGWNTVCNALGTALAAANVGLRDRRALFDRLAEDWGYMTVARPTLSAERFPEIEDLSPDASARRAALALEASSIIKAAFDRDLGGAFGDFTSRFSLSFPWSRRFEAAVASAKA